MRKTFLFVPFLLLLFGVAEGQELAARLDGLFTPYVERGELPGVVVNIADKDGVNVSRSYGWADVDQKKPMSTGTLFWIASQSKPITGAALMILADEGKVGLDAPVGDYLPQLRNLYVRRIDRDGVKVLEKATVEPTLRMLMSHTAGMSWVASVQESTGKIDVLPLGMSTHVSATTPLLSEPGTAYSYSNQGINVVAAVIEKVSGMPFEEFLAKRLFEPLGMSSATFWPAAHSQLAIPYRWEEGRLVASRIDQLQYPLDDRSARYPEAAGGLFCTPDDLVKFYRMIAGGGVFEGERILSQASVDALGTKQTPDGVPEQYGLGWDAVEQFSGHGGAYGTNTKIYRKNGLVVMYFIQEEGLPKQGEAFGAFENLVRETYGL